MKSKVFFAALGMAIAVAVSPLSAVSANAQTVASVYTPKSSNVAVGGYDTVSYFTDYEAIKGSADYKTEYQGAEFHFSSQQNLDMFKASPAQYAPQYGGYCAWAVAHNKTAKGNPKNWAIVYGKLYLNLNNNIQRKWSANQEQFIQDANGYWPQLGGQTSAQGSTSYGS